MADIQFSCPHCAYHLSVSLGPIEVVAFCPYCQGQIQIPRDNSAIPCPVPPPVAETPAIFEQQSRQGTSSTATRRAKPASQTGLIIILAGAAVAAVAVIAFVVSAGSTSTPVAKARTSRKSQIHSPAQQVKRIATEQAPMARPSSLEQAQESVQKVELALEELHAKQEQVEKLQKEVDALNSRNAFYAERKAAIDARVAKLDQRRQTELKPLEQEAQQLAIRYESNRQRLQSGKSIDADLGRAFSGPSGKPQVMRDTNNLLKDQQSVVARMAEVKLIYERIAGEIDAEYAALSRELEQLANGRMPATEGTANTQPSQESRTRADAPSMEDIDRLESTVLPPLRAAVEQLEKEVASHVARLEKFRSQQRMMAGMQSAGLPSGSRFNPGPAPNADLEREARAKAQQMENGLMNNLETSRDKLAVAKRALSSKVDEYGRMRQRAMMAR